MLQYHAVADMIKSGDLDQLPSRLLCVCNFREKCPLNIISPVFLLNTSRRNVNHRGPSNDRSRSV